MKILLIGDVVNPLLYSPYVKNIEIFKNVELIISTGDLPFYYYDFLISNLNVPLFYVFGNHTRLDDEKFDREIRKNKKRGFFVNIDNKVIVYKNIIIAGLEGSKRYNMDLHQYTESQMKMKIFKLIPALMYNKIKYGRYIDILVTHAPPYGFGIKNDPCHQGFKSFLFFIEKFKPSYLVHSHIHIYDENKRKISNYKGTKIINAYNYRILDIEPLTNSTK